jgi:hypothetical protein
VAPLPLRSRLAGLLRRAAAALERAAPPAAPGPVAPRRPGEPPEHWLRLVRDRAPRLLEGGGIGAGPPRAQRGRAADPAQLRWPVEPPAARGSGRSFPDPPSPSGLDRVAFPVPSRSARLARPGRRPAPRPSVAVPPRPGVPDAPAPGPAAPRPVPGDAVRRRVLVARHIAVPDGAGSPVRPAFPPDPRRSPFPGAGYPADPARRPSTVDFPVTRMRPRGPLPAGTPGGAGRVAAARWPGAPAPALPAAPTWPRLPDHPAAGPVWPHPDPDPSRWPTLPDDSPLWTMPGRSIDDGHRAALDDEQAGR